MIYLACTRKKRAREKKIKRTVCCCFIALISTSNDALSSSIIHEHQYLLLFYNVCKLYTSTASCNHSRLSKRFELLFAPFSIFRFWTNSNAVSDSRKQRFFLIWYISRLNTDNFEKFFWAKDFITIMCTAFFLGKVGHFTISTFYLIELISEKPWK